MPKVNLSAEALARIASKEGKYDQAPELVGIVGYINTDTLKIADLRGKVVLVDFWTYTCINCIRTFPFLTEWDRKYRDKGLVIIGVHTPEFEFEKKKENVVQATERYGIAYPVVQDNEYATWSAYRNRFWPRKYLIDQDGFIRYDHIGEGAYQETELKIQELLAEIGEEVTEEIMEAEEPRKIRLQTPELYAGYAFALPRGQNLGNTGGFQTEEQFMYTLPSTILRNVIILDGLWQSNQDNLEAKEAGASLVLDYTASQVNIVLNEAQLEVEVFIDDAYITPELAGDDVTFSNGKATMQVDQARLYNVVNGPHGRHTLRLTTNAPGWSLNAFTFG